MLDFHKNHRLLVLTAFTVFLVLSIIIAVIPAYQLQETEPLPNMEALSDQELRGLQVYTAENCVACHTQQVRNIEMDNTWGDRPSMASDYYYSKMRQDVWRQSPSILGSERTGPDLTNVGKRQPGEEWHLLHLYNPRIVVKESIMPSYPWLFEEVSEKDIRKNDLVVPVPSKFLKDKDKKIIASEQAKDLIAYLQSLKQASLTANMKADEFIPASKKKEVTKSDEEGSLVDGAQLYMKTCAACHQADGQGLSGAFPPLAGSSIVNDSNPETLIKVILQGYDARAEYGVMAGFAEMLTDEEVAAIANHERSSWGNSAPTVTKDEVKKIRDYIKMLNQ